MSRVFTDPNLMTWEAYSTGGAYGLPENPAIVFNCLSDPESRARFTIVNGTEATAQEAVHAMSDDQLRKMLAGSSPLD